MKKKDSLKLSLKQRKFIKGRLAGNSAKKAALDAGYSPSTAVRAAVDVEAKPIVQATMREAMAKAGLTSDEIAKKLREGANAMETKLAQRDGVFTDRLECIDYPTRLQYLNTALKIRGDLVEKHDITTHLGVAEVLAASWDDRLTAAKEDDKEPSS